MKTKRFDAAFILILLAAAFLNTYHIWQEDTANQYYLAAVKSMTQSFHNFFYASFDPSGFVTVDKPPVVLWIQTIFALIFGVHMWSVIIPQALAGVGSVFLLYKMIKPTFGIGAARIAAFVMALTPIAVAVSRTNNIDSMLVFTLLLGSACLFRAVKQGKLVWLLTAFALIGLAFNMKMMQAFMVLPAFVIFYRIASRVALKKKIRSLLLSLVLLTGLSLSWAVAVDSTSPSSRPYVGSSQTNSVLELAFGYNGTERLLGQTTGLARGDMNAPGGQNNIQPQPPNGQTGTPNGGGGTPPIGGNGPGNGGHGGGGGKSMNMFGTGDAGPLRLFQSALSGQISWMLPFALIGLLGGIVSWHRDRRGQGAEMKETLFWTAWLVPVAGFFSIAGFFHQYYLIMLAPPIAALSGIGWHSMYRLYKKNKDWSSYLLPAAVLITAAFQVYILSAYTSQIGSVWMYVLGLLGLGITLAILMLKHSHPFSKQLSIISLCILLLTPVYWSATPILYGGNSVLPESGPQLKSSANGGNMFSSEVDSGLLSYLRKHNTGEEYLFATLTTVTAAPYIIYENESVMAMGGFNGTDPILTVYELRKLIKEGKVKYFLLPENNSGNSELVSWIKKNGKETSSNEYNSSSSSTNSVQGMRGGPGGESQQTLYLME